MPRTTYSSPHNLFSVPDISSEVNRDQISGWEDIKVALAPHHSHFIAHELISTAIALVNPRGKGVYATDESPDAMDALLVAAAGEGPPPQFTEAENRERRKRWREVVYDAAPSGKWSLSILVKS